MERQLVLIETDERDWRLDEPTRDAGRRGIEAAREALRKAAAQAGGQAVGRSAA
ncbi:MAG: hypothetical protein ACRDZQ_16260 [Acidimicrobiales bacterium]